MSRNGTESGSDGAVVVGLVADPGLSTHIANRLADELPDALAQHVSDRVSWEVRVTSESVPLDANGDIPLTKHARKKMPRQGWDFMVCLTDLPRRLGTRPVIGECSTAQGAAQVSLPVIGWGLRLRRNVRDTIIHLVGEMASVDSRHKRAHEDSSRRRARQSAQVLPTSRQITSTRDGMDVHLVLLGLRGKARLLFGMVRINRPWRLVYGLSRATATAAAGAAFGIFFSNVWSLADALSAMRLTLINVFVVAAMVVWLIAYNSLWETPVGRRAREQAVLYNAATVLTLSVGVACMYAVLFGVTLLGAVAVISSDYLQSMLGHPVGLADYATLVWLSSSMGTLAGALGSGLESEDAVRRATYSRRERERQAMRQEEEGEEEPETDPATSTETRTWEEPSRLCSHTGRRAAAPAARAVAGATGPGCPVASRPVKAVTGGNRAPDRSPGDRRAFPTAS